MSTIWITYATVAIAVGAWFVVRENIKSAEARQAFAASGLSYTRTTRLALAVLIGLIWPAVLVMIVTKKKSKR